MSRAIVAMAVVLGALSAPARATPTEAHPLQDTARVVRDADEPALEEELRGLRTDGVALGVLIVNTTGRESIESFARARRTEWATGPVPAVLFVLAIKDRKSRLEVNDALRDAFPDARAQAILDNLKGYLRSSDYPGAIRAVIREVRNSAAGVAPDLESPHPQSTDPVAPPVETQPVAPHVPRPPPPRVKRVDVGVYVAIGVAIVSFLLGAWLWARSRVASRATLTSVGAPGGRAVWLETIVCMGLIVVGVFYVAMIILAATGKSSGSSSSSWSSSSGSLFGGGGSSSGGSSSGGGGGWSGGGASSGW